MDRKFEGGALTSCSKMIRSTPSYSSMGAKRSMQRAGLRETVESRKGRESGLTSSMVQTKSTCLKKLEMKRKSRTRRGLESRSVRARKKGGDGGSKVSGSSDLAKSTSNVYHLSLRPPRLAYPEHLRRLLTLPRQVQTLLGPHQSTHSPKLSFVQRLASKSPTLSFRTDPCPHPRQQLSRPIPLA